MDQRIRKTKRAIYKGLAHCLKEKDYRSITVGDVIEASDISRSTFYAHYRSVDDVVISIGRNIFDHVFSHALSHEATHDFSKTSILDYSHFFTHIFYHLFEDREIISALLASDGKDLFLKDFRTKIEPIAKRAVESRLIQTKDTPIELRVLNAIESFIVCMTYWFMNGCKETPENMTAYFVALNQ